MKHTLIFALILLALFGQHRAATVAHQATLYWQSTSCTAANPCTLQVFRATCKSATSCPPWGNGHGWVRISPTVTATFTAAGGTAWVVSDKDTALQDGTTYEYAATNAWASGGSLSGPSPLWQGTTTASGTPPTPTNGSGNSVH
jgi:hypothetical protein